MNYGGSIHFISEPRQCKKKLTPTTSKTHFGYLGVFHFDFFRHNATFFEIFWILPKRLPCVCFDILQHKGCQKIPRGPPLTFFGTVTLFKNHILNFSRSFFKISLTPPLTFFHILQPTGVSQSPKGPPFTILSLRYSILRPTLAVPGLFIAVLSEFI